MKTSWRTTLGGTLTSIGSGLLGINFVPQLSDVVPPKIKGVTMFVGFILTVAGPALHGFFARDNIVTSAEVKAASDKKEDNTL